MSFLKALGITIVLVTFVVTVLSSASAYHFKYPAKYIRNYDGDTITLSTEIWPGLYNISNVRLLGVDTPELHTTCSTEKLLAVEAKQYIELILKEAEDIEVTVFGLGKYGRPLVSINYDGNDVAEELLAAGLAREYDGHGPRETWCDTTNG